MDSKRHPAQYEYGPLKIEKLTFDKTVALLKDNQVKNIEEALKVLSEKYPDYMKLHTLMYDSFSLHESSFQEPRAIVFGPRADFILTFNGGLHRRAGNALETMQFDETTGKFEFREIEFKTPLKNETTSMLKEGDIVFENDAFKYTKANPQKCATCHGQSARPIWETYFLWPGAYGGHDDILTSLFNKNETKNNGNYSSMLRQGAKPGVSQGRLFELKKGVADRESLEFRKFIASKAQHPRYKYLPNRAIDQAFVRLNKDENPERIDNSQDVENEFKNLGISGRYGYLHSRPNFALNELLYDLVGRSFVTRSLANKKTKSLPFKVAWISQCHPRNEKSEEQYNQALESVNPFNELKPILSQAEITTISTAAGPWNTFFRKFIEYELDMEADKVQRFERGLGANTIDLTTDYRNNFGKGRDRAYYKAIKGRELNRFEVIASHDEYDNLFLEALVAYVAKGYGIDFYNYTTTLRRVPTLREGGHRYILEDLARRNLISQPPKDQSFYGDNLKSACTELEARAKN